MAVTVDTKVITYPQKLLGLAQKLIDDGEFPIAVVVAHAACEVATERSLPKAFDAKGIAYLEGPVTDLYSGSNLATDRGSARLIARNP
jgi:hypothetical protein